MKFLKKPILLSYSFFKRQSRKKKIAIIFGFLILAVITANTLFGGEGNSYKVEKVKRAEIIEKVDESGTVKISGQTDIYSPTNGLIEEIYVANGDYVEENQDLFKVKSTATLQEQQAAYANYAAAYAALNAAKSNLSLLQADMFTKWDSFKALAEDGKYEDGDGKPRYEERAKAEFHISEKAWLSAEQKYKDQQQVIAQAQAAVSSTWLLYQATQTTVVKATIAGTISNLSVILNDSVSASSGNSSLSLLGASGKTNRPVLTIADFSVMGVLLSLGEADINKVKQGESADINVDAVNNRKYKGIVSRADTVGYDANGVMKYDVFIEITNPDDQLKSGMSADAIIITKKLSNILSVPNTAIKPYKGGKAVQVVNSEKKLEFVPVKIGVRGEQRTEIISGIKEGQEVVVALTNKQAERPGMFAQ